jgi:hypothetical protein
MDRQEGSERRETLFSSSNASKGAFLFQIFYTLKLSLFFFLSMEQGMDGGECVCELHARKREGRKETAVMASWGSFVYDFVRCSF